MADRNSSPKAQFLTGKKSVEAHNAAFGNPDVQRSIQTALLHMQWLVTGERQSQPNEAFAGYQRLRGANEFVNILLNLGESAAPAPQAEKTGTLDHKA